jgi:hypothetical protein
VFALPESRRKTANLIETRRDLRRRQPVSEGPGQGTAGEEVASSQRVVSDAYGMPARRMTTSSAGHGGPS